jgi:hypothetical protein
MKSIIGSIQSNLMDFDSSKSDSVLAPFSCPEVYA